MAQICPGGTAALMSPIRTQRQSFPLIRIGRRRRISIIRACSEKRRSPLMAIVKPLRDFGFGEKSIWEGGVGLFLVSGAVMAALTVAWARGFQVRSGARKYSAVLEFSEASGIQRGTPVRIRGVSVGKVVEVRPSLGSVCAAVEVDNESIVIPLNSVIEVNQSGLLMETLIDVTPRHPIPAPSASPLDGPACLREGLVLCHRQTLRGRQGVSLDALVGIFTRLGRETEEIGLANAYAMARDLAADARPLLRHLTVLAEDLGPLLAQLRDSQLLSQLQPLTATLAQASQDLRTLQSSMATQENAELIQQSVKALISTLKNIENISSDVLGFTGDEATRRNLKSLIKSLSRLL